MIGDTAITGAAQSASAAAHAGHREDRFDADERIGWADDHRRQPWIGQRLQKSGLGTRRLGAVKRKLVHHGFATLMHEVVLEIDPAFIGAHARAHRIIAHRQHARPHAEAPAEVLGDHRQCFTGPQSARALDMHRKIAVAQPEPGLAADRRQRFHERPGLVMTAPAELRIGKPGQRVHHRVDVGRNGEPEMVEIIARIGDDQQFVVPAARD